MFRRGHATAANQAQSRERSRAATFQRWVVPSGLALLTALAFPGTATATPQAPVGTFAFTGNAYGSTARLLDGTVTSGRTADVSLGCTDRAGISKSNTTVLTDLHPLLSTGTVTTNATTSATSTKAQSQTNATTQGVDLLGGAITADAVVAQSTTSHTAAGFAVDETGSNLVHLRINGTPYAVTVAPNTTINLVGLGTVVLNEVKSDIDHVGASLTVNMIHVTLTVPNPLAPVGTEIIVSHATSDLEGPTIGAVDGRAYGTSAYVGTVASSGPTAVVVLPCLGTDGSVITNTTAGVALPSLATTGLISDTAEGTVSATSENSETTSTVQSVSLLEGLVSATVVRADAHASMAGTTTTLSDAGSTFATLSVAGDPGISVNVAPNTVVPLPGIGTLYLHRVIQDTHRIEVRMIELVVGPNLLGLPVGLDVRIAVAEASVH